MVGRPPFRGATDYLTFQKILKMEMEFPDGFNEDARALVELVLVCAPGTKKSVYITEVLLFKNLDPAQRLTASDIKSHPFFAPINLSTLWTSPAPTMSTGLSKPTATLASIEPDSDIWAVFEDEVSDGGFEFDSPRPEADTGDDHRHSPQFDHTAAASAVRNVDEGSEDSLEPPRPSFADLPKQRTRGWSSGKWSARTSSSSSGNRTALTGLLETMGMIGTPSGRASRTSNRSEEVTAKPRQVETGSKW